MKKIIALFLTAVLFVSPFNVNAANISTSEQSQGLFSMVYEVNTDSYQKIKFINNETEEVEYLESKLLSDGQYVYTTTTTDNQVYTITSDLITQQNLSTGELQTFNTKDLAKDLGIGTLGVDPGTGAVDNYYYTNTTYGSKSLDYSGIATIVAIVATIAGVSPGAAIALSIATFIYGAMLTEVYYKTMHYYKKEGAICTTLAVTYFYSNSDRTKLIGSASSENTVGGRCY